MDDLDMNLMLLASFLQGPTTSSNGQPP